MRPAHVEVIYRPHLRYQNNYLEEFFHRVPSFFELYWSSKRITCPKTKSPASSSTWKKIVVGPKMPRVLALFFVFLDHLLKHLRINLFALWFLRQRITSNYWMKLSMICWILQISTKTESNNCFIINQKWFILKTLLSSFEIPVFISLFEGKFRT